MVTPDSAWGSNAPVSLPVVTNPAVERVDFEGFCFTPDGIRINLSAVDREEMVMNGFHPGGGA